MWDDVASETVTAQGSDSPGFRGVEDGLDLRGVWFVLLRRKWIFAAIVAAVLALTVLVSSLIGTVYTATAKVIIEQSNVEIMDEEGGTTPIVDSTAIDTQVQLITSRSLLAEMVRRLNLVEDPEFNPFLEDIETGESTWIEAATGMLPVGNDDAQLLAAPDEPIAPQAPPSDLDRLTQEAQDRAAFQGTIDRLAQSVNAYRDGLTFVIAVTASSRDADKSAVLANALAQLYIDNQLEAKVASTRQAGDWLTERLDVLRLELQTAETAVEDFRIANGMVDTAGVTTVEAQIAELTGQLVLLETDLAEQEARVAEIRSAVRQSARSSATVSAIDSPLLTQLRGARAAATRALADIESTKGPQHPDTVSAEEEVRELDTAIGDEIARVAARQESSLTVARNRVADVEQKLSSLRREQDRDNVALIRLRQLQREAAASRAIYEALLTRAEEVTEQELLQRADARVLSPAESPSVPSAPNHRVNLLVGAIAALALAALAVLLLELFESGFASADDVEKTLGLPILASVAEAPKRFGVRTRTTAELADYMTAKPNSAYTESIRSLYAALHRNRTKDEPITLAVTSTLPGEGKTSLTLSLARLAAEQGDRVVVIDADLRRRSISKLIGETAEEGFRDAMDGRVKPRDVLVSDPKSSAMLLPSSKASGTHQSVVLKHSCKALFDDLKHDFDLIIVDCPPVLPVMESRTIASAADATIFAIRWRKTHQKAVRQAVKMLLTEGAVVLGGMLTRTNLRTLALYDEMGAGHYKKYASYYRN